MTKDYIGIRYAKDGDIETYDKRTGKTTGHISTMGNYCVPDGERKAQKQHIAELKRKQNRARH
ncbi:MAG: hypothetical protein IK015_10460 [Treponema sp.]|nr:hypothetical protein [Treponema sp.]